ncbi:hypothetical protein GCM10027190_22600 [Spirosoma areae]
MLWTTSLEINSIDFIERSKDLNAVENVVVVNELVSESNALTYYKLTAQISDFGTSFKLI